MKNSIMTNTIKRCSYLRTCELVINSNLEKKEALDLYTQTLNVAMKIAEMDKNAGVSSMVAVEQVQNNQMIDTTTLPATK